MADSYWDKLVSAAKKAYGKEDESDTRSVQEDKAPAKDHQDASKQEMWQLEDTEDQPAMNWPFPPPGKQEPQDMVHPTWIDRAQGYTEGVPGVLGQPAEESAVEYVPPRGEATSRSPINKSEVFGRDVFGPRSDINIVDLAGAPGTKPAERAGAWLANTVGADRVAQIRAATSRLGSRANSSGGHGAGSGGAVAILSPVGFGAGKIAQYEAEIRNRPSARDRALNNPAIKAAQAKNAEASKAAAETLLQGEYGTSQELPNETGGYESAETRARTVEKLQNEIELMKIRQNQQRVDYLRERLKAAQ